MTGTVSVAVTHGLPSLRLEVTARGPVTQVGRISLQVYFASRTQLARRHRGVSTASDSNVSADVSEAGCWAAWALLGAAAPSP